MVTTSRDALSSCEGRHISPANYHATLAFPGPVPVDQVERLIDVARSLRMPPLSLVLDRFGHFKQPQVFWIGGEVPAALDDLVRRLWSGLEGLGITAETRPFHLHVTLARKVRRAPRVNPPAPVAWAVSGIALVESRTGQQGASYHVIQTFPP